MIKGKPPTHPPSAATTEALNPVREKIILAAIETIEAEGYQSATIRTIARRAGVNSAAINYYFRSKENLLEEVFNKTIEHSSEDLKAILGAADKEPRTRIEEFLLYLMDGAVLYPGLTKSHMYDVLAGKAPDNLFLRRINARLAEAADLIRAVRPGASVEESRDAAVRMISAVILPALMPRAFRPLTGKSFGDAATRRAYVRSVVDSALAPAGISPA
jgi:AcrR family transcriptional regulator